MDISTERVARADPRKVFELAAAVQDWPRILPHYRWVRVLGSEATLATTFDMAARRHVIGRIAIPLRWTAVQRVYPAEMQIDFEHVAGITRGMRVTWTISPIGDSTVLVRIRHVFTPRWPVPDGLVRAVVGEYFVDGVARRTLRRICDLAQRPS
jgi:ribosome-associated toxin RatA of RatAB toxin-antitoxin module